VTPSPGTIGIFYRLGGQKTPSRPMGGDLGDRRSVGCEAAVTEETALDTKLLNRVATVLYGARWHAALADDVGVSVRQVQRWLAQLRSIPRDIWPTLDKRLAERSTAIRELRGQLHSAHEQLGAPVLADEGEEAVLAALKLEISGTINVGYAAGAPLTKPSTARGTDRRGRAARGG
jgi:hypothetical protein